VLVSQLNDKYLDALMELLVTVYGSDVAFCSSTTLFVAPFSDCMTAKNVSQFSVDCQDFAVATSAVPSVVATGAPNPTGNPQFAGSSNSGESSSLSGGAKAGIAVGASVFGLGAVALLVFFVVRNNRKKRANMEAERAVEADSRATTSGAEMSTGDRKPPMEMKAAVPMEIGSSYMNPIEAPSDGRWPKVAQELDANYQPSEMSSPAPAYPGGDARTVVSSEGRTLVDEQHSRTSKADRPQSQP
jgi:hypothetical protein